jgi:uncharacterized protein DUF4232
MRLSAARAVVLVLAAFLAAIFASGLATQWVSDSTPSNVASAIEPASLSAQPTASTAATLTSPEPDATENPMSIDPCAADDLAMAAGGWGGATGSMAGGATLINVSIDRCRLSGKPAVELLTNGRVITSRAARPSTDGEPIVLPPGGVAGVITVWMNWCGDPPELPLRLRLVLPDDGGTLVGVIRPWANMGAHVQVPRCDAPGADSTIGVPLPFEAAEIHEVEANRPRCTAAMLSAYLGGWGVAAGTMYANVVVLNRSGFDCLLETSPDLELRDGGGTVLAIGERWDASDSTLMLRSGWAAITTIGFADWCQAPPELPLRFDLRVGGGRLAVAPTSERSEIGTPSCNSHPASLQPSLGYVGPFALPDHEGTAGS